VVSRRLLVKRKIDWEALEKATLNIRNSIFLVVTCNGIAVSHLLPGQKILPESVKNTRVHHLTSVGKKLNVAETQALIDVPQNDLFSCKDSLGVAFKGPTGITSGSNASFRAGLCVLLFNSQTVLMATSIFLSDLSQISRITLNFMEHQPVPPKPQHAFDSQ
jgi:hypothetical protein